MSSVNQYLWRGDPGRRYRALSKGARSVIAAAALSGAIAACGSSSSASGGSGSTKGPVLIGVSISLSGDFSSDGHATQQGYQTWAAWQNAHGGILGRPVKLVFLSDGSIPTQVLTNYQDLITSRHVNFVLGPFSTLLTQPASVIANRYGYVMLEGAGGGPSVFHQGLHNVFDVSPSASQAFNSFGEWVAATQPKQSIAYATLDDPFLKPGVDGVRAYLQAHGFGTGTYKVYPAETSDHSPITSAIVNSGAKIVVVGSTPPDGEAIIQEMMQAGYNPRLLIEASGPDQGAQFVKAIGAKNTEGIMVGATWYPTAKEPGNAGMVQEYLKLFGSTVHNDPNQISSDVPEAFSAGQVLAEAVNQSKTLDNAKLETYLHSGARFASVQGPVQFASNGQNSAARAFTFQWQHQKLVPVLPVGQAGTVAVEASKPKWGAS